MTIHENYAWLNGIAAAWLKTEQAKAAKPYLALVSATPQPPIQGKKNCTASNDSTETWNLSMTTVHSHPLIRPGFDAWNEITRTVDDARGLALIADLNCIESIIDDKDRENARRALISTISALMEKTAALLPMLEPN